LSPSNAFNRKFVAIVAGPWTVLIVKVGRAIQGSREEYLILLAKKQNVLAEEGQVRCND
jgi:hypothetical protein